jgi:hypothetical protein
MEWALGLRIWRTVCVAEEKLVALASELSIPQVVVMNVKKISAIA